MGGEVIMRLEDRQMREKEREKLLCEMLIQRAVSRFCALSSPLRSLDVSSKQSLQDYQLPNLLNDCLRLNGLWDISREKLQSQSAFCSS